LQRVANSKRGFLKLRLLGAVRLNNKGSTDELILRYLIGKTALASYLIMNLPT
jgi:hypothetical protein